MTIYCEVDTVNPERIALTQFEWRHVELLRALPSSSWDKRRELWTIAKKWAACLALKADFGGELEVGPNLRVWMDHEYNNRIMPCYNLRDALEAEGEERLFPHQRADVLFLSTAKRALLANGLGSGKTQSSFSAVKHLASLGEDVFPVLVVCPNSTKISWQREIEQVWPGLDVVVIDGTATQRRKQFADKHDVIIINWDILRLHSRLKHYGTQALKKCVDHGGVDPNVKPTACEVHPKELNEYEFKTVIGDELHRIIDPASKVSKAFKAATGDAEIRLGLTGTPIADAPDDLFSLLNWMDPESYPSKLKFVERYCDTYVDNWGITNVRGIKKDRLQEFFNGIDPFLRRMPKEAILRFLPPILRSRRDVEMTAKQKKAYAEMEANMIAQLDGGVITSTSALTMTTRLLQLASAYGEVEYKDIYNPEKRIVERKAFVTLADPSCKLDAFMEDIPEYGEDSVIVFAVSSQLINMLSARMTKAGIPHGLIVGGQDAAERQLHMDNFQNGLTKFILVTISAGGTGITLTKGRVMAFLQRSWSMIENIQAEGRGHRIGSEQHESVSIVDYVTKGTREELVFEANAEKGKSLQSILRDRELLKKFFSHEKIDISQFGIETENEYKGYKKDGISDE